MRKSNSTIDTDALRLSFHSLAVMNEDTQGWKGVPREHWAAWGQAFQDSPARIRVSTACPVCSRSSLFQWHDGGRGLWQWCMSCRCYEHASALVPPNWQPEIVLNPAGLTAEPTAIVTVLKEVGFDG